MTKSQQIESAFRRRRQGNALNGRRFSEAESYYNLKLMSPKQQLVDLLDQTAEIEGPPSDMQRRLIAEARRVLLEG